MTPASIANRRVFYNRSTSAVFGDGSGNPTGSIDSTKSALQPGQTATFANVTNYSRGLNGLIIDVANLNRIPTAADFQFATSNGSSPLVFAPLSAVPTITVLPNVGFNNSTRLKIEFADNAIRNTWLRVTVLATGSVGLTSNDVFYFGNAVGEMNVGNLAGTPVVLRTNASDTGTVRQNQSPTLDSVPVTSIFDLNKDGRVNATDTGLVRQNQSPTGSISLLIAPTNLEIALSIDSAFADMDWLDAYRIDGKSRYAVRR